MSLAPSTTWLFVRIYPSELTTTPEPRLCSLCSRGTAPKNCRRTGSLRNGKSSCDFTTREEEMLTIEGTAFFTTGANDPFNGTVFASDAADTVNRGWPVCLPKRMPAIPLTKMRTTRMRKNNQTGVMTRLRISDRPLLPEITETRGRASDPQSVIFH